MASSGVIATVNFQAHCICMLIRCVRLTGGISIALLSDYALLNLEAEVMTSYSPPTQSG